MLKNYGPKGDFKVKYYFALILQISNEEIQRVNFSSLGP